MKPIVALAPAIFSMFAGCGPSSQPRAMAKVPSSAPAQPDAVSNPVDAKSADQETTPPKATTLEERYAEVEQRAVAQIQSRDLAAAERELRELLPDAEAEGDLTAVFVRYEIAWLRSGARDAQGALDELRATEEYMDRVQLMGHASVFQHLNILWFRALFLLELAREAPAPSRAGALARAQAARRDHEARSRDVGNQAQADLLAALFAVHAGNRTEASQRSKAFALIDEPDPTSLFVMVQVYSAIGKKNEAEATLRKIEAAEPSVLRSLVLLRLQRDG